MMDDLRSIRRATPAPALYELLAEECAELGHAALKYARALRQENPTPVTPQAAEAQVLEELADVILTARVLDLEAPPDIMAAKLARWSSRIATRSSP